MALVLDAIHVPLWTWWVGFPARQLAAPFLEGRMKYVEVPRAELKELRDLIRRELSLGLFDVEVYAMKIEQWLSERGLSK